MIKLSGVNRAILDKASIPNCRFSYVCFDSFFVFAE